MEQPRVVIPSKGLRWSGQTDRGRVRTNNEDAFLGLRFDAQGAEHLGKTGEALLGTTDFVFAVSDGMGGAHAGEFASRITIDKVTRLLPRSFRQTAIGLEAGFTEVLEELFDQIHRALLFLGRSDEECFGMGSTLSLCWFTPTWMYYAHIGDTRIYYLPAKREPGTPALRQLTHDDTHVGWLLRNREITEFQARNHPRRSVLQKALGAGNQFVDPQVGAVAYEPGDRFLLCTDGLIDGLHDERLAEIVLHPPQGGEIPSPAYRLVEAAVENSGRDNTTAMVVEMV